MRNVLITGGAGFIGSHLADELLAHGYRVRALDNLTPQVHGALGARPTYLSPEVELFLGDVRDADRVDAALEGIDAVFHFAAAVGVGQSMYEVQRYNSVNVIGTSVLMERLVARPVQRLVVASSMSVYGEGYYLDEGSRPSEIAPRTLEQLRRGEWEPMDSLGNPLVPAPTPETKSISLESVYAISKYDQERLCLVLGRAYGIPTIALRFFNVYGARQALSNPYTGVLAIFAARLLNRQRPLLFEDGNQRRDFVSVKDVARACRLALEKDRVAETTFNIGSGHPRTIAEIARRMAEVLGTPHLAPEVTGRYRAGDVRHCFADISRAQSLLDYHPEVTFEHGLVELAEWLAGQADSAQDRVAEARAELDARGLTL